MSLIPTGVGLIQAGIQGLLQTAFFQTRSIGEIVADITIEEIHTDELRITDHPVERNAVISDHAFKLPERVVINVGYSNSSPQAGGSPDYIKEMYTEFLTLQESRELIYILTGKRLYQNMLIERLSTNTDEKSENALFLRLECREVIIVDTQVTQMSAPQDQTQPGNTAGVQNEGAVATAPATNVNQTAANRTFGTVDATFGNTGSGFTPSNVTSGTVGAQSFNTAATTEVPVQTTAAVNSANQFSTLGPWVP